MARAQSQVYTTIRGSVGGVTYFANQFHPILVRARVSPIDPNTTKQSQVRQAMTGAAVAYNLLTEAQKVSWDTYADTLVFPNPLGPITVPGRQVMVGNVGWRKYLTVRGIAFIAPTDVAPTEVGFLSMDPVATGVPVAAGTGFSVSFGNPNAENCLFVVNVSRRFTNSRFRFKGPFDPDSLVSTLVVSPAVGFVDILGGQDGDIFFVNLRAISHTGPTRTSRPVILRATVATTI